MKQKIVPREFAVLMRQRKAEVEMWEDDLVLIYSPNTYPTVHEQFCFFTKENEEGLEFRKLNEEKVVCDLLNLSFVEVIARKGSRQHEILVDTLSQKANLERKVETI